MNIIEAMESQSSKSGAVVKTNRTTHHPRTSRANTTQQQQQQQHQWHQNPLQIGESISATILLSDWDKFGLSERVCYHFDLIETLTASSVTENEAERAEICTERNIVLPPSEGPVCGVASLLECVPKTAKYRRRDVRSHILSFNMHAQQVRHQSQIACFEPAHLPLRLSPATRVWFTYELTKVAFCIDASPTLVSTFGNGLGFENEPCCALDRLGDMASVFFKSLVKPITAPWLANPKGWRPNLAVTVLAVYPNEVGASDTSILVRDFRVHDVASADLLSKEIAKWVISEVEDEIANRMGHTRTGGIASWNQPPPSSTLRDIFDAGDVALSLLPSRARPIIVLATACRSVACENILDLFRDPERVDTPLIVLDLSSSSSHSPEVDVADSLDRTSFLTHDPGSSTSFPLYLSDDSESLFGICQATGGAFFDANLLNESSHTVAGKVPENSPIAIDSYFSFKRRALRPNAVQWYTLFSLSPLSPCLNPSWGKLVPPLYLRERLLLSGGPDAARNPVTLERRNLLAERTAFSIYIVSPIRVKGLLLLRIKEGYRAKQYGSSTQDPDKVSIQFTLPLEFGTVLHYELSYKAIDDRSPFVGVANVKIELSGEKNFIQAVKNDFISSLAPAQKIRPSTVAMRLSAKLCKVLRGMRREDCLQAYLCPLSWADKLSTSDSPFARRLGTLSHLQRRKHFRLDQFDVLCIGRMPYEQGEYLILSEFIDFDSGEQEFFDSLEDWSTQAIKGRKRYVKRTVSSRDDLVAYCVIEVTRSGSTSRIFTLTVESFGGSSAVDRLALLASLKEAISNSKDVVVLPKPMNDFLVGLRDPLCPEIKLLRKQKYLESHFHHESWSGGPNPELLSLLTKRRNEVGLFWFLKSSDTYSLFAKLVTDDGERLMTADFTQATDLVQVQYQIAVVSGSIVIDMHVEREQGVFFAKSEQTTRFHELFDRVRVRDQECGRALSSRTSLLALLNDECPPSDQQANVERLLKYASRLSRKLRFFHSGAASANIVLEELTTHFMLSNPSNIQVKRLPLDVDVTVGDVDSGIWFLIQFDGHTMGFAHLGSSEREERTSDSQPSFMYRELTFFSIGMSDLYAKRDLIADDDSADSHISEYMCVSEFADEIEGNHGRNFARAAYLALRRNGTAQKKISFEASDFQYAVGHCRFVEFKGIALAKEIRDAESLGRDSSLSRAITDALTIVPGDRYCLFYNGDETQMLATVNTDDSDTDAIDDGDASLASEDHTEHCSSDDGMVATNYRVEQHYDTASSHALSLSSDDSDAAHPTVDVSPPIFVRFLIDDELIDIENDINRVDKTATLKAQISLFDSSGTVSHFDELDHFEVPEAHQAVVLNLRSLLDTYVAERLLERLRQYGDTLSRGDLKMAKQCLRKARILSRDVNIQFYDAKSDSLNRPRAPSGSNTEIDPVYSLFCSELQEDNSIQLIPISLKGFFVMKTEENGSALSYWCFVTLKIHTGVVNVRLYHPEGKRKATEAISSVLDHIVQAMHRFNQMLLLQSLHRNRIASSYLIGSDDFDQIKSDGQEEGSLFTSGSYACPVQFKTSFSLYDRCLPAQVVLSLEASVLHSFAVSNRRGIFVYKDESESIFYMKLKAVSRDHDATDSVELLVYGLRQPGPSVTVQLSRLLQRKVHMLAVDALSTVLTKNPHLKWKTSDLLFLRSFEKSYPPADDEKDISNSLKVVEYAVPGFLYDPIMLLMYFRQNICGSTYFHRLQQSTEVGSSRRDNSSSQAPPNVSKSNTSAVVPFDPSEFSIFYNNAPSPLDPEFQPVCTLTAKGAEYSRRAGTGIALIDVTLITRGGQAVQELNVGQNPSEVEGVSIHTLDVSSLRFKKVNNDGEMPDYRIRVSIADTALDREALHSWIELTLNQVLIAWVVERYIQRSQLGQRAGRRNATDTAAPPRAGASLSKKERRAMIDKLEPGFPHLYDILDASHDLPSPAIEKLEMGGVIKASSVASVALALLEKCLNGLFTRKSLERQASELCGATIIRISRTQSPTPVSLVWDSKHENALAKKSDSDTELYIQDSPIDCPEYVCFYCFSHHSEDDKEDDVALSPSAMCFREVMVNDKSDGRNGIPFVDALLALRETNPSAFSRSLVFVLSVKRNLRTLMAYNWNPQAWKSIASQLKDANATQRSIAYSSVYSLQKRCLQILSPEVTKHEPPSSRSGRVEKAESAPSVTKKEKSKPPTNKKPVAETETLGPRKPLTRRIQRPTSIRRPKLVGKSVEGAAVQAMAASRARASANRGSSPFQKAAKTSSKTKEDVGSDLEASVSNTIPSAVEAPPIDINKHASEPGQNQRASVNELSLLVKRYVSTLSLTAASPFDHSRIVQSLIDKQWLLNPERPLGPAAQNFLLSRSIKMWSRACEPTGFPDRMLMNISGYFAQWLNMSNEDYNLLQLNAPSSTLIVELKRIYDRKLCVVLQTSLNAKGGSGALRLEAWMVLLPSVEEDMKPTKRRIARKSVNRFERDATLIDKKLCTFSTTNLEVQFFNFSSFLIEQSLNRWRESFSPVEMLSTVRVMIDRYPLERQMKMDGMQYAALEAPIVLASYQNKLIDFYDSNKLFDYLASNAGAHDMIVCNPDGLCFLNLIPVQETTSMCFLTRDRNVVGKLQLVILTRLEGRRMDEFVFRKGNPIGVQMFDAVSIGGAAAARDALQIAALNIRKEALWARFSSKTAKRGPSKEELCELLRLISSGPVADIDSRLPTILFDRGQEYGLDWHECLKAMAEDALFSPHSTFDEQSHTTRNLFYMAPFDEFLSLSVNKDGILIEASLLWRDRNDENSTIMAGQAFANFLFHYIWHDTVE